MASMGQMVLFWLIYTSLFTTFAALVHRLHEHLLYKNGPFPPLCDLLCYNLLPLYPRGYTRF